MKVLDPGHTYSLDVLDNEIEKSAQILRFVKRDSPPEKFPGNIGSYAGTNCQEVLRALIDRVQYLNNQIPHGNNDIIIGNLRHCILLFELRAAERHDRLEILTDILGSAPIEQLPTCSNCGHVGCSGCE